jgi:hypothetical protein
MKIYHSNEFVNVSIDKTKQLIELNALTDEEISQLYPELSKTLNRDEIIKAVVFGIENNNP